MAERIGYATKLERVLDAHRVWPAENPGARPSFDGSARGGRIAARVELYLRKSAALEAYWQRPVTERQLQIEVERMAKSSRDPALLRELFAALDDDPYLIAECIGRPAIATRDVAHLFPSSGPTREGRRGSPVGATRDESVESWLARAGVPAGWDEPRSDPGAFRPVTVTGFEGGDFFNTAPKPGLPYSACWTGTEMFVWAGPGDPSNAGMYNPATDTWRLVRAAPGSGIYVSSSTCVWTGSLVFVFAGDVFQGRYDPATDSWLAVSQVNIPSGRVGNSAIWTGSEVIIWGGDANSTLLNDGGRYDPVTDTWRATSTGANVPAPRAYPGVVWTGSEMIVWGGFPSSNTGGRYNPAIDSWLPMSTGTGVPTSRSGAVVVWTGSELMAWGGYDSFTCTPCTYFGDGARYDPVQDRWTAMSAGPNVPTPRGGRGLDWHGDDRLGWRHRLRVHRNGSAVCPRLGLLDFDVHDGSASGLDSSLVLDRQDDAGVGCQRQQRRALRPGHRRVG